MEIIPDMGFPTPFGVSRSLADAAGMTVWEYDAADDAVHVGPGAESLGLAPVAPPERLQDWLARLHPEEREDARAALATALAGGAPLRAEWRLASGVDSWRWVELRAGRVEGPSAPPRLAGVLFDIGARKARDAAVWLAVREVEHRAKNALSTAQALVRLTRADNPRDFARAVDQRLAALGRAHARLSAAPRGCGIALRAMAEEELAPYGEGRHHLLHGPEIELTPTAVQPVCMALHELVTNAAKHGGLSRPGGTVRLRWRRMRGGMLALSWRESGGPPVLHRPERRGFGLTMLEALLQEQIGGVMRPSWHPDGLRLLLCLPEGCIASE